MPKRSISDFKTMNLGLKPPKDCLGYKRVPFLANVGSIFNPIEQTPMDAMHILADGICRYQAMRIFEHWIEIKRCSIEEIERCLLNFDYKSHADQRIKSFNEYDLKKGTLIVTAAQATTLFNMFPFIFEDILDIHNEEYQ